MQPCLNPVTANVADPEAYIALAAKNGFTAADHGADFWTNWVDATSLDHVKAYCGERQCGIGHGGMRVNFREGNDVFLDDLTKLPKWAETMRALETRGMATWIMPVAPDNDVKAFRKMHVDRLRRVAEILGDHDLKLGLEFVGPKTLRANSNTFVCDMPGMLDLCAEIDDAHCGLLLDSYHWYTSRATADDIRAVPASKIVHVHINDAYPGPVDELLDHTRLLPGEGVIDLNGFLGALHDIGYDGPVAVETFGEELKQIGPKEAARRAGEAMVHIMHGYMG